jgi:methylmalonyl-CoA mutase
MTEAVRSSAAPTEADWQRLAERAIGAGIESLRSPSADGLAIAPLYPRLSRDPCQPWRSGRDWAVSQRMDHPDPEAANALALRDLEGGADALVVVGAESPFSRGFGMAIEATALHRAFEQVELDFITLRIEAGGATAGALDALAHLVSDRRLTSAALAVDIGFDPIGWAARTGLAQAADDAAILNVRTKAGLAGTTYLADGRPWHEAGAGEVQELAIVLATAVAYLRRQDALGLTLPTARDNIGLLLAADADVFLGLAKFRAIRRLWARVEALCNLAAKPIRLHAETSWRMMARDDPWTNVMRATAATFAAGLGGADTICVLPFTLPLGLPDADARRLARNVQRVLLDEAHLAKVLDPAAGAGGFEALTEGLCDAAWALFQDIEREGGIESALETGTLRQRIQAIAGARARAIATLEHGLIGTSRFASLEAQALKVLDVAPRAAFAPGPKGLTAHRDALPFERLRDRARGREDVPRVFLATLGAPAVFGPRAAYAANFFAAAGLAVTTAPEGADVDALAQAFAQSACRVACLCGADAAYAQVGAPTIAALRASGARRILRVGSPEASDVDAFIHEGCDALECLAATLDVALGMASPTDAPHPSE